MSHEAFGMSVAPAERPHTRRTNLLLRLGNHDVNHQTPLSGTPMPRRSLIRRSLRLYGLSHSEEGVSHERRHCAVGVRRRACRTTEGRHRRRRFGHENHHVSPSSPSPVSLWTPVGVRGIPRAGEADRSITADSALERRQRQWCLRIQRRPNRGKSHGLDLHSRRRKFQRTSSVVDGCLVTN